MTILETLNLLLEALRREKALSPPTPPEGNEGEDLKRSLDEVVGFLKEGREIRVPEDAEDSPSEGGGREGGGREEVEGLRNQIDALGGEVGELRDGVEGLEEGMGMALYGPADEPFGELVGEEEEGIHWGKVRYEWSSDTPNQITVNPCEQDGSKVNEDITRIVYLTTPINNEPDGSDLAVDDVICYVEFYDVTNKDTRGVMLVHGGGGTAIRLGHPTEAYTDASTIDLDPCDAAGVDNGEDNVEIEADAGWELPEGTSIPVTAIVPFAKAQDGDFYILGQAKQIQTDIEYNQTYNNFRKKLRLDFGWFSSTESDWIEVIDLVDCTAV